VEQQIRLRSTADGVGIAYATVREARIAPGEKGDG
jgi:hypothetical protein